VARDEEAIRLRDEEVVREEVKRLLG